MAAWPGMPPNRYRGQIMTGKSRSGRGFYYENRRVLLMDQPGAEVVWAGAGIEQFTEDVLDAAFRRLADDGLSLLQSNTPVDSGDLQRSAYVKIDVANGRAILHVGATEDYTIYVELGTSARAANPFIRRSFDVIARALGPTLRQEAKNRGAA